MTPAERKRKSRKNAEVKKREKLKKKELENNLKDTEEGISALREKWQKKKHNQRQNQSKQKSLQ